MLLLAAQLPLNKKRSTLIAQKTHGFIIYSPTDINYVATTTNKLLSEFLDHVVEAPLKFRILNQRKLLTNFPTLLPQV